MHAIIYMLGKVWVTIAQSINHLLVGHFEMWLGQTNDTLQLFSMVTFVFKFQTIDNIRKKKETIVPSNWLWSKSCILLPSNSFSWATCLILLEQAHITSKSMLSFSSKIMILEFKNKYFWPKFLLYFHWFRLAVSISD